MVASKQCGNVRLLIDSILIRCNLKYLNLDKNLSKLLIVFLGIWAIIEPISYL